MKQLDTILKAPAQKSSWIKRQIKKLQLLRAGIITIKTTGGDYEY